MASFCLRVRSRLQAEHTPSDSYYDSHFVLTHLSVSHHRQSGGEAQEAKDTFDLPSRLRSKPPGLNI